MLSLGAKSVLGIDIDKEGIEMANGQYQSPNIKFDYRDIFKLKNNYKEKEFDVCISIETFEKNDEIF